MLQRGVARGGEVVDPGELEDLGPARPGDLAGAVDAAGIDDDDLVEDPAHRFQAMRQVLLLVPDDHGQAGPGEARHGRSLANTRYRGDPHSGAPHPLSAIPPPDDGTHGPQRDPPPQQSRMPPLGGEPPRVLFQKSLGVDPVADERPAAEVVDEQVMGHGQLEAGPTRPHGQVVVVEESQAETLVQAADGVIHGPLDQDAEPRQLGHGEPLPAVLVAPAAGEGVHRVQVAVGHGLDELRRRGVIRHRPDQADDTSASRSSDWAASCVISRPEVPPPIGRGSVSYLARSCIGTSPVPPLHWMEALLNAMS